MAVTSHGLLGDRFLIPGRCGVLGRPEQPLRSLRATRTFVVAHHHDRLRGLRAGDRGELLLAGHVSDLYGRRAVLLPALAVAVAVGGLFAGLAGTFLAGSARADARKGDDSAVCVDSRLPPEAVRPACPTRAGPGSRSCAASCRPRPRLAPVPSAVLPVTSMTFLPLSMFPCLFAARDRRAGPPLIAGSAAADRGPVRRGRGAPAAAPGTVSASGDVINRDLRLPVASGKHRGAGPGCPVPWSRVHGAEVVNVGSGS